MTDFTHNNGESNGEGVQSAAPAPAGMNPAEWEAYRRAVFAAADVHVQEFDAADPRAAVPVPLRPGKHHVHKAYVWLGGITALAAVGVALLVSMVGSFGSAMEGASKAGVTLLLIAGLVAVGIIALAALVFVIQWLSWKNLTYELGTDEFSLYSGIISKKRRHVPYQRVQAVNQKAGILQRIFGLCTVQVDTAGGAANEAILLPYLRTADAEALRAELFRRKKVLLASGTLDAYGNAFVAGAVVPSAWMAACASNSHDLALAVLGAAPQGAEGAQAAAGQSAAAQPSAAGQPYAAGQPATAPQPFAAGQAAPGASGAAAPAARVNPAHVVPFAAAAAGAPAQAGNMLDGADEVLNDIRGVFGGAEVATGRVSYEEGLSNKELVLAAISSSAGAFGAVIVALLGLLPFAEPIIEASVESWAAGMVAAGGSSFDISAAMDSANLFAAFANQAVIRGVLGAVGAMALLWLFSVGASIIQYGGFKVRRRESRIEVEHGLLQRNFHGVDVDRVQSVIVKQGFVRRCMGYCELSLGKIDSTTSEDQNAQVSARGVVVHPFVKLSRVPEILAGIAPEFADTPALDVKPAPVALRRAIVRRCIIRSSAFWMAVGVSLGRTALEVTTQLGVFTLDAATYSAVNGACLMYLALFVLIFALNTVSAVLWFRQSGMGYDRNFMRVTNGGLTCHTVVFPRKKIQFAYTKTNPFQRMAKVCIVNARTATGVGGTTETLWDVSEQDAQAWLDWVRPRKKSQQ